MAPVCQLAELKVDHPPSFTDKANPLNPFNPTSATAHQVARLGRVHRASGARRPRCSLRPLTAAPLHQPPAALPRAWRGCRHGRQPPALAPSRGRFVGRRAGNKRRAQRSVAADQGPAGVAVDGAAHRIGCRGGSDDVAGAEQQRGRGHR